MSSEGSNFENGEEEEQEYAGLKKMKRKRSFEAVNEEDLENDNLNHSGDEMEEPAARMRKGPARIFK
jgi:hypothetical protein